MFASEVDLAVRLAAIGAVVGVAAAVAWRRRRAPDAPTQPRGSLPAQLNRADFDGASAPWLVVVFTSATCNTCADVARKATVLASSQVVVQEVEFARDRALHDRYRIDAVPTLVIADSRCRDPQLPNSECAGPTA